MAMVELELDRRRFMTRLLLRKQRKGPQENCKRLNAVSLAKWPGERIGENLTQLCFKEWKRMVAIKALVTWPADACRLYSIRAKPGRTRPGARSLREREYCLSNGQPV
jgi:hypothetical protein